MSVLISALLPVYNCEAHIFESVRSILDQTYEEFELIIINDGSTDGTAEVLASPELQDERIRYISRDNLGLIASLNEGIDASKGDYIARMDADDISHPERFEKQVQLLEESDVDVCGCHYMVIDSQGRTAGAVTVPIISDDILLQLCWGVPFAHGSVMIKAETLRAFKYSQTDSTAVEDYALWAEMRSKELSFGNVDEFLFSFRLYPGSFSSTKRREMSCQTRIVADKFFSENKEKIFQSLLAKFEDEIIPDHQQAHLMQICLRFGCAHRLAWKRLTWKNRVLGLMRFYGDKLGW